MIKKLFAISILTFSCFAANPGRAVKLDTRPTVNLNQQASSSLAQRFAQQKIQSTSSDINKRTLGSFLTGAVAGIGLITLAKTVSHNPVASDLLALGVTAASIPLVCFTYYPGSTKYDYGSFGDWAFITFTRSLCNGLAFYAGLFSTAAVGVTIFSANN